MGVAVMQRPGAASKGLTFSLRGGARRKPKATLRKRDGGAGGGEQYALSRYEPALGDVVDEALAGRLPPEEYPTLR